MNLAKEDLLKQVQRYIYEHLTGDGSAETYIGFEACIDNPEDDYYRQTIQELLNHTSLQGLSAEEKAAKLEELEDIFYDVGTSFSVAMLAMIAVKGYKEVDVYKRAGIDRRLFSKIRNDIDYAPSKNTAVALAIGLQLNLEETTEFLERAGYVLSGSSKRDLVVKFFIENQIYDMTMLDYILESLELPTFQS